MFFLFIMDQTSRSRRSIALIFVVFMVVSGFAQNSTEADGKTFTRYQPSYFKPHRGIYYTLYASPVVTVDPLELGGKSTYGVSLGSRFRIWESYSATDRLGGLKLKGIYTALGYEYYPQQYSKTYISTWIRIQNFIPLVFKGDVILARGYGLTGISFRSCVGTEVKNITILLCGENYVYKTVWGYHPNTESPYTNAGMIMVIIPIYNRKEK